MKSINQLNYSLEINETINNLDQTASIFYKEYIPKKTSERSLLFKAKKTLIKMHPSHWFDGVWDDLSIKM